MSRGLILVVEDDRDYASILEDVLSHGGFEVEVARDAKEALARFAESEPALALVDIVLPGLNGIELCSRLRRTDGPGADIPLLLMSGVYKRLDQVRQDMIFCGATDFLTKPIPLPTLLEKIEAYLQYEPPASMDGGGNSTEEFAIPPPMARSMEVCPRSGKVAPMMMASVLYRLMRDEFTGVLRVKLDDEWRTVSFDGGVPVGADGNARDEQLGTLARTAQLLDRRSYNKVLAWVRKKECTFAQALLDGEFVEYEAYLDLLRLQVRMRLEGTLGMKGGIFEIKDGPAPESTPLEVPLLAALFSAIRKHAPLPAMEAEVQGYMDHFARASGTFARHWEVVARDIGADPRPPVLDGTHLLGDLVDAKILPPEEMLRLVWLLLTCEALSLHSEGRHSIEAPMTIAPDAVDTITATEQAEAVIRAWLVHEKSDHYELIGARPSALIRDLEVVFEELDFGFDPELLSLELPDELRQQAATLQHKLEEARETLLDPAARKEYDRRRGLQDPAPPSKPSPKVEARALFEVGRHFVRSKNFIEAQRAFTRAVERVPTSPEYKTHLGWATYRHASTLGLRDAAGQGLAFLEDALRIERSTTLAHYFSGVIHREAGDLKRAHNAFYLAVSYNPEFEPAKRALQEVRDAQRDED